MFPRVLPFSPSICTPLCTLSILGLTTRPTAWQHGQGCRYDSPTMGDPASAIMPPRSCLRFPWPSSSCRPHISLALTPARPWPHLLADVNGNTTTRSRSCLHASARAHPHIAARSYWRSPHAFAPAHPIPRLLLIHPSHGTQFRI